MYKKLADKLTEKSEVIDEYIKSYRFSENMDLITDLLF